MILVFYTYNTVNGIIKNIILYLSKTSVDLN